jgi:MoaD family protein
MKILIKYFASFKERTGISQEHFHIDKGKSINDLLDIVTEKYNFKRENNLVVSLNHNYSKTDAELNDGDEVAIMLPSSGG